MLKGLKIGTKIVLGAAGLGVSDRLNAKSEPLDRTDLELTDKFFGEFDSLRWSRLVANGLILKYSYVFCAR
jgi:hypothetical protein